MPLVPLVEFTHEAALGLQVPPEMGGDTVDGNQKSGINSPVEVGSLSVYPIIYKVLYNQSQVVGFLPSTVCQMEVSYPP